MLAADNVREPEPDLVSPSVAMFSLIVPLNVLLADEFIVNVALDLLVVAVFKALTSPEDNTLL